MLIALLAFLVGPAVLPGPPSGPIRPPGMICLGACAGPVIYGPAEQRGRLVVACDMRSDTCSDGRKITTTRATPVPCETSPGVWEMVPEDTACISYRGLEVWAGNTSYLSYGAELDRSPWTLVRGGTVEKLPDGWRVKNDPNQNHSGMSQVLTGAASGEVWTSAYILRTSNDVFFQLWAGSSQSCGGAFTLNTGGAWRQFSCSTTVPASPMAAIHPGSSVGSTPRPQYSVDVKAAWTVKADTPGRPCWGGEAPVTCAADQHAISTEGWPTEAGEVCVTVTLGEDAPSPAVILDGRASSGAVGTVLYYLAGRLRWTTGSTEFSGPPLQLGQSSAVCAGRSGGRLYVRVNGAHHEGPEAPALSWEPTARLGHGRVTSQVINGSISSLTVRSFE